MLIQMMENLKDTFTDRPDMTLGDTIQLGSWDSGVPRSKYVFIFAFIAFALSAIEILDPFELPFEAYLASLLSPNSLSGFTLWASQLGYVGLFLLMLLESASLPIPSEVVLPFTGYLVYTGSMTMTNAILVATVAGVLGALVDYYLAIRLGRPALRTVLRRLHVNEQSLDRAESWFNSRGSWSVFVSRFIPGLRGIISFPAGLFEMKLPAFVSLTFVGALGWTAALVYFGFRAGPLWQSQLPLISLFLTQVIVYAIAALSGLYLILFILNLRSR